MRWDVVEVRTEGDLTLFVRFKDGLEGRLQLRPEELTGVLSLLRDSVFFRRVYVEMGVVTWPGRLIWLRM